MLCVNLTGIRDHRPIVINERLLVSRMYIGNGDIPSFPNRIVFNTNADGIRQLITELRESECDWLNEELQALDVGLVNVVIPFALRVQEEAYTSFQARSGRIPANALTLNLGNPVIFIRGTQVDTICLACERQATLRGRQCPDYQAGAYECFRSSRFALATMDTFYLTEKGELIYNAASINDESREEVEDNAGSASDESII